MKKSLFNKSAVALAAGLFAACAANAYVVGSGAAVNGVPVADTLVINQGGLGHQLFVPYYTAQNGNRTYLTIVNTDMRNGKAVKVRFRGASNSDDVLDFTVFLSPGDAWTSVVYAASNANPARLEVVEGDTSCTAPAIPTGGVEFRTFRLHPQLTPELIASETREGYIEIFNEADIPPAASATGTNPPTLYQAINHGTNGVPASCDAVRSTAANALSRVDPATDPRAVVATTHSIQDLALLSETYAQAQARGFEVPTSGLMASWAIANPATGRAWSGNATAVEAQVAASGASGFGNIVYHPQRGDSVDVATIARLRTSDPLLRGGARNNNVAINTNAVPPDNPGGAAINVNPPANTVTPLVTPLSVDLPDMSTPYLWANIATLANGVATRAQAQNLTAALSSNSVSNEILTLGSGRSDWSLTFPTRRYNVARAYATGANESVGTTQYTDYRYDDTGAAIATGRNYFNPANIVSETVVGRRHQLCVTGIAFSGGVKGGAEATTAPRTSGITANRDESFLGVSTGIDFSPAPPAGSAPAFCGEAGVFSYNRAANPTGVLGATVAIRNLDTSGRNFGWIRFQTLGLQRQGGAVAQPQATTAGTGATDGLGLPVVGLSFWTFENMSIALPHRKNF